MWMIDCALEVEMRTSAALKPLPTIMTGWILDLFGVRDNAASGCRRDRGGMSLLKMPVATTRCLQKMPCD